MTSPTIVFDVGGTLIHPDFEKLRDWVTQKIACNMSVLQVENAFRLAIAGDIFKLVSDENKNQAMRFFTALSCPANLGQHWDAWWSEVVDSGGDGSWLYTVLDADAVSTLVRLEEFGCRLIAASNSDGTLEAELRSFGIRHHFDALYDSTILGVAKPSHEFYESILQPLRSSFVVHVGDDLIKDVVAASAAGVNRALLFDPSDIYRGVPTHVKVHRLSEIPAAIGFGI